MKKKILATMLTAILVFGIAGCGSSSSTQTTAAATTKTEETTKAAETTKTEETTKAETSAVAAKGGKVGVCLPIRDQYWTTFEKNITADLKAAGYEVQVVVAGDAGEDVSTQISQVQTFNNNGFDAVILGMATGGNANDFLKSAGKMKVVFFNRTADASALDGIQAIYVGMAEYDAGKAQGKWLADYFKNKGQTDVKGMMFLGTLGQDAVTNRTQGAKDALKENGINVDWVFEQSAEWDRTKSMNMFTQFVGTGAKFDFVCSNNDDMALGVVEACSASNIKIDFPIVGVDATQVGCLAIQSGTLAMTVNQDPAGQAKAVVNCLGQMIAGSVPKECDKDHKVATSAVAITPSNVADLLATFK